MSVIALHSVGQIPLLTGHGHGLDLDGLARALCDLGRVERIHELGSRGPLVATATGIFVACNSSRSS